MLLYQFLPVTEMLIFNLISIYRCCHKKYSLPRTVFFLVLSSILIFMCFMALSPLIPTSGDGNSVLFGLIFLIPFKLLFKEDWRLLIIISCTCWVYTMGVLSLSIQLSRIYFSGTIAAILIIENIIFAVTSLPFFRQILPRFIFVTKHLESFDRQWYIYMTLNDLLGFLLLVFIHGIFIASQNSMAKVLVTALLLAFIYISYYIIYRIVIDTLKMNNLKQETLHDPLTGLGNRTHLWNELNELIQKDADFSLLFMDLDRFKHINDHYGHMVGDKYLQHFSKIVSEIFDRNGTVHRFGGDEFVAIYSGTVPDHVFDQLKECKNWDEGAPCPFNGVSIGVLYCTPPHHDAEQILRQVDQLMYQNKVAKKTSQ